ncbi:MAG: PorT family protein [Bacteroidetes bacterium]|nr:MAG: PorT family protein [Bacteroidota bacterium]
MKRLSAIVLIVLMSVPAFSQIKFGLKAGVSTSSLSMPTIKTVTSGTTSYTVEALTNAKYGFHGGAFVRLSLLGIYLQPELLFSTRTNEYTVVKLGTTPVSNVVKQSFNKLDIPVMLGFKLGPVRLNAGPAGSLLINSPKELIDSPDYKSIYSRMTIGYQAGLGIDVLNILTVDLRYEGSLKKYQNQIENLTGTKVNLDDRANAFLLSLGLIF